MVDVSGKKETEREAVASGRVTMAAGTYALIRGGQGPKGDIFTVAKIAGIMAAKKTHDLIPLCHPLAITHVDVEFRFDDAGHTVEILSTVRTKGQTGVEMEALTSATVAGLTIYDMCKAVDKGIELGPFFLLEKSGGKSGTYKRKAS
jgi:cyclic pyranopterin phosphate synthase